ncbi:MAG: hypothetical protein JNJ52_01325 [Flavobacterium sp.]|nr:hypothetical protein [Flavobacterium sp.]
MTIEIIEQINQYLKGTLPEDEKRLFEKKIAEDETLREEVIIQKQLFLLQGIETNDLPFDYDNQSDLLVIKNKLQSEEYQLLSAKIRKAGVEAKNKPTQHKNYWLKYAVAASIALVFGVLFYFNSQNSLENYYHENVNWEELPSFIEKGQSENDFSNGELLFKKGDYKKAIETFNKIESSNQLYPYSLMYIGASYDVLNENDKAIETFDLLSSLTSFQENSKGYWYKMLIYMKQNNKDKMLEMRSIILSDPSNFNYTKAKNLKL